MGRGGLLVFEIIHFPSLGILVVSLIEKPFRIPS
jgi:hypothetical protein